MPTPRQLVAEGCPARRAPPANNATPQGCFVLFDRHLEKSGGSTLSVLMQRLEEQGECMYWGYHVTGSAWSKIQTSLSSITNDSPRLPRLCIDGHVGTILIGSSMVEKLGAWKRDMESRGVDCRLLRTMRVREPMSHYTSFYLWYKANKGDARRDARASHLGDEGFIKWANATPNLQTNLLLHSMTTLYAQTNLEARPARVPGYMQTEYEPGKARLIDMLKHFEIAAPLERFDEALLMTADKLGLRHVQYARVGAA